VSSALPFLTLDRYAEAEKAYRRAIQINDALSLQFPEDMRYLRLGVSVRLELAATLRKMRRFKKAEDALQQSLALLEKLPAAARKTGWNLRNTYRAMAQAFAETQRPRQAEEYYGKALRLGLENLADSPKDPEVRMGVSQVQLWLAILFRDTNRLQEAEKLLRESITRVSGVVADFPHTGNYRMILVSNNLDLSRLLVSARRLEEAENVLRESLPHAEKLVADAPDRPWHQTVLREHLFELAALLSSKDQETEAERYYLKYLEASRHEPDAYNRAAWALATRPEFKSRHPARAVAFAKKAVELAPDNGSFVNTLGTAYYRAGDWKTALDTLKLAEALGGGKSFGCNAFFIAMTQEKLGAKDEARKWYTAALAWMENRAPQHAELLRFRAEAAALLGLSEKAAELAPQALSDDLQYLALILDADAKAAWAYQQRGQVHLSRHDYEKAIPDFEKAVELDPKNATLHLQLGSAREKQGKLDEAISAFRQAIELSPKDASSHRGLTLALLNLMKSDNSTDQLRKTAEQNPGPATAYLILGSILHDKKKPDEAVACYRRAIELDPKRFDAHLHLGLLLRGQNQLDGAVACFHTCLELDPDHFQSHLNLGWVFLTQHKPDQALVSFRKAIALGPNHGGAHYGVGRSLMELKEQPEEAIAALRQSIKLDPKRADAHIKLGMLLHQQNLLDEAVSCFRNTIALDPQSAFAHGHLGSILALQGKTAEGMAMMRKAIELNPKLAGSHNELAWYLATAADPKLRDAKAAVSHARTATALQPDPPFHWRNLGVALLRDGDHKAAVETLEKFEAMTKGAIHSHRFFLAMAYWQTGDKEKAGKAYEQAARWLDKQQPTNEEQRRFRAEAAELLELKDKK
jgi:tetratricopeptide (TPR) repeat protein